MGEFKVDHATIAFRLALAEASEQEQARADALQAFWQRSVLVATWPGPNEAPRTLTNSHGETALPLFTGLDALELGADRFSWREPNGSIRYREMSAREAFRYALTRQVNFVVVDVGFEHNVEFAREEFESLVLQQEALCRASTPSAAAKKAAPSPTPPSAATTSAPPIAANAPTADAQGAHTARNQQTPRPSHAAAGPSTQPPKTSQAPRHSSEAEQSAQASASPQPQPQPPKHRSEPAAPTAHAPRHRAEQPVYAQTSRSRSDQPAPTPLRAAARAIPQQAARAQSEPIRARASSAPPAHEATAPKHPSSVPPNLPLGPPIHDVQVSPRLQSGAVPIQQPHQQAQQEAAPRQRSGAVPIQQPPSVPRDPQPEPPPPLANNSARSLPPRRRTISASPPPPSAYPPSPAETASTIPPQQDLRPTAAPPPRAAVPQGHTHPQASFVPRPHSHAAPVHAPKTPTPTPQTAPPKAAGELRRTPPPVPEAAKSKTPSTPGTPAPISDGPFSARPAPASVPANDNKPPDMRRRVRDDEPTLAERPNRANTQRGLQASVPDAALEALSSELRGFPEVEWACVLVDDSDVPLIGVRVDPSFLNRVADITDVILDVGERQSLALQVLLLNNQDQVKNARRNGRAFYPWTTTTR